MVEFKFKKNPKSINLDSVIIDSMLLDNGNYEPFCEGKVTICYNDNESETFLLHVMCNVFKDSGDEDTECNKSAASFDEDVLSQLPDDKFMFEISHSTWVDGSSCDVEDQTASTYKSMNKAFSSPLGDILRKLTIKFAVSFGLISDAKKATNTNQFYENSEFRNKLIQNVVLAMYETKFVLQPMLNFLRDDTVFDLFFQQLINGKEIQEIARTNLDLAIRIAGCHSFGAGIVFTMMPLQKYGVPLEQLSKKQVALILSIFLARDPYEIALLSMLNLDPKSKTKKVIDCFISIGVDTTEKMCSHIKLGDNDFRIFCWVLFNAGFTLCNRLSYPKQSLLQKIISKMKRKK